MAIIFAMLFLLTGLVWSQGIKEVVIYGYPLGVGESIGEKFYHPYDGDLRQVADYLNSHKTMKGIITGASDQFRYQKDHDAKNPGLALGRAIDLKRYMIERFGVDSTQLVIQVDEPSAKGAQFRYASIRLDLPEQLPSQVDTLYMEPRIIIQETNNYWDNLGLNFRIGVSSSPYGAIPIVAGAIVYKDKLHVEAQFGHTFWSDQRDLAGMSLSVWRRMSGGQMVYFLINRPQGHLQVGPAIGWFRIEEISQYYYGYTRMSEGLTLGVRLRLFNCLDATGSYFPHKERAAERQFAVTKDGSFLMAITFNHYFGGGK